MKKTVLRPGISRGMPQLTSTTLVEPTYSAAVIVDTVDARFIYSSGRVATNDGAEDPAERQRLVGVGDLEAQTRQVLENLKTTLEEAGGSFDDVVRIRLFVVSPLTPEKFSLIHEVRAEYFSREHYPASTLVSVSGLVRAEALIEIDVDAVIPIQGVRTDGHGTAS